MIYFDNSATTAVSREVLDTFVAVTERYNGNASSLHELGVKAEQLLTQSRRQMAASLGVEADEIFFTSGGTEGDNWAIKGTAIEKRPFGKHLITTTIEHPAVKESMKQLELLGFDVTYIPVNHEGIVSVAAIQAAIRPDTILVSVMAVNNEVGSVQPIAEIGEMLKAYPTVQFHVDAVQAIGKTELTLGADSPIDFATFSAHKFHALKGAGFLYVKKGKKLAPLLSGGGQEQNLRSGTENVPGIAAMSKALRLLLENQQEKIAQQRALKNQIMTHLAAFPQVTLFTSEEAQKSAPHIICFALKGIRGEVLVHAFEEHNIFISTTSACSSKLGASSSTLSAMNVPGKLAVNAVRVSLSDTNTAAEVEQFLAVFDQLYQKFSTIMAKG